MERLHSFDKQAEIGRETPAVAPITMRLHDSEFTPEKFGWNLVEMRLIFVQTLIFCINSVQARPSTILLILGAQIWLIFREPCQMCPSNTHIAKYDEKLWICTDSVVVALRQYDRRFQWGVIGLSSIVTEQRRDSTCQVSPTTHAARYQLIEDIEIGICSHAIVRRRCVVVSVVLRAFLHVRSNVLASLMAIYVFLGL